MYVSGKIHVGTFEDALVLYQQWQNNFIWQFYLYVKVLPSCKQKGRFLQGG